MKSRSKAVLWVVFVFFMGTFFGVALTYFLVHPAVSRSCDFPFVRHLRRHPPSPERVFKHFSRRLELDSEQRRQLRQILERSRKLYRSANQETRKLYREVRQSTLQEIRTILRPDQLPTLEKFIKRRNKRLQKRHRDTEIESREGKPADPAP